MTTYEPGAHLRVKRALPGPLHMLHYWHHGIAVTEEHIVDFGGGDLLRKGDVSVREIPYDEFAAGGVVQTVTHPIRWMALEYSPALPAEETVDRARWLLRNQPPPYQLGYRNCESIALWCATGDFETFQVKKFLSYWLPAVTLGGALASRQKRRELYLGVGIAQVLVTIAAALPYLLSRALFNHVAPYPGIGRWTIESSD